MASAGSAPELSLGGATVLDMLGSGSVRRQTLGIRYNLNLSSDDVVWLPLVEWSVSLCYPNAADDERQVLVSAFCHAYASSTTTQYVSSFRAFAEFCCTHDPELPCLPASKEAVHLFLASKALSGSLDARSLAMLVSAVNGVHNLMGLPAPIVEDRQHSLLMAGLGRVLVPVASRVERQPLLASMLLQSLRTLPLAAVNSSQLQQDRLSLVVVLLGFVTGLRGSALARLVMEDLSVSGSEIRLRAQVLKQRHQPRQFSDWVIPLQQPPAAASSSSGLDVWLLVRELLSMHLTLRQGWPAGAPLFAPVGLPVAAITEATVDSHVVAFVTRLSHDAAGFSSHSLRIGAASAMVAAGVSRSTIRLWFKWQSEGMIDLYARVVQCDAAVRAFFSWMLNAGNSLTLYA